MGRSLKLREMYLRGDRELCPEAGLHVAAQQGDKHRGHLPDQAGTACSFVFLTSCPRSQLQPLMLGSVSQCEDSFPEMRITVARDY